MSLSGTLCRTRGFGSTLPIIDCTNSFDCPSVSSVPGWLSYGTQQLLAGQLEVGWDKEIDDDFKKLTVGPVKGGRHLHMHRILP